MLEAMRKDRAAWVYACGDLIERRDEVMSALRTYVAAPGTKWPVIILDRVCKRTICVQGRLVNRIELVGHTLGGTQITARIPVDATLADVARVMASCIEEGIPYVHVVLPDGSLISPWDQLRLVMEFTDAGTD